jgi:putative copper export protein
MTDLAWLVLRALSFALTLQAAGMALFRVQLARYAPRAATVIAVDARRAAVTALIVVAVQCAIEPAHLAGEWSGVLDPRLVHLALAGAGAELAARLAALVLLAVGARRSSAPRTGVLLAGAALAALSFVLSGHAPESERALLLVPLLFVHVAVVAFWFGALWPLYRVTRLEATREIAQVLTGFSRRAVWLVPLIAVAGIAIAAALLPDLEALGRPYGLLLLGKAGAFALLLALAALNRLRLVPAIASGERGALGVLRGTLIGEYLLLCAALTASAVMSGAYSPS